MITNEIRDFLRADPFKPLRIVIDDKRSYIVSHIDYVAVSPDGQSIVLYDEKGHFRILNAQQIKLVEPVKARTSRAV
jgi:hypothetical protein